MPEIKCHHGCSLHVSTPEWVATLTVDQLRCAREAVDADIKAVEESPKRTVWRDCGKHPKKLPKYHAELLGAASGAAAH